MPQLDQIMISYASQLVSLLAVLVIIYFGIARTMLPKIQSTIDARAKRIADDLAAAEKAHETADEIEETYREQLNAARADALALTSEASANASAEGAERVAAADAELDLKLAAAEKSLNASRAEALGEIEKVAVDATQQILVRIADSDVSKADARAAVKEAMADG
jgi:F-type H+-transporting ATPase subunit b